MRTYKCRRKLLGVARESGEAGAETAAATEPEPEPEPEPETRAVSGAEVSLCR